MPARFFPFASYEPFLERKTVYMMEFKCNVPEEMSLQEFYWLSTRADSLRELRKDAIEKGQVPL